MLLNISTICKVYEALGSMLLTQYCSYLNTFKGRSFHCSVSPSRLVTEKQKFKYPFCLASFIHHRNLLLASFLSLTYFVLKAGGGGSGAEKKYLFLSYNGFYHKNNQIIFLYFIIQPMLFLIIHPIIKAMS